jgi:hypothetical protein
MSLTSADRKKTVEQNAATHRVITKQFSDTNQLIWRNNTHIRIPSKKKEEKRDVTELGNPKSKETNPRDPKPSHPNLELYSPCSSSMITSSETQRHRRERCNAEDRVKKKKLKIQEISLSTSQSQTTNWKSKRTNKTVQTPFPC